MPSFASPFSSSLRMRILGVFLVSLFVYIAIVTVLYARMLDRATRNIVVETAHQSAAMLMSGIELELDNTRYISNSLLLNPDLRKWLHTAAPERNMQVISSANDALVQTYATFPNIESIYVFDTNGERLSAANHLTHSNIGDICDTAWYWRAISLNGGGFITLNADGTLYSSSGQNNISYIRQILDLHTMQPTGFLVINMNEKFLLGLLSDAYNKYGTQFYILDEQWHSVIQSQHNPFDLLDIPTEGALLKVDHERLFVVRSQFEDIGWNIISATPYSAQNSIPFAASLFVVVLLSTVVLYILASISIAQWITWPIRRLITSMNSAREGHFEPVAHDGRRDEVGLLEENYNIMINTLLETIQRRIDLEKEKQGLELRVITEQFKPHFLYNTLDSISFLVVSGENKCAYEAILALSRFYKASLANDQEMAPLRQEIDMVRSYLILQKMRYADMIQDVYEIDPSAEDMLILRNILQPIVENCIYHGIKPSGEPGTITVAAHCDDDYVIISVCDNGVGMTPEQIEALASDKDLDSSVVHLGVRGTIKRLQLFYGQGDIYRVTGAVGEGVKVTLKLPTHPIHANQEEAPDEPHN